MTTLEDLEWELALTDPAARGTAFRAMVAAHPDHADQLADWLCELALDELRADLHEPDDIEPAVAADDPAVLRAIERLTANLRRTRSARRG